MIGETLTTGQFVAPVAAVVFQIANFTRRKARLICAQKFAGAATKRFGFAEVGRLVRQVEAIGITVADRRLGNALATPAHEFRGGAISII